MTIDEPETPVTPDGTASSTERPSPLTRRMLVAAFVVAMAVALIWPLIAITTDESSGPELEHNPALEVLREGCLGDLYPACDELFRQADLDTHYAFLGDTCNGQLPQGTGVLCVDAFGPGTPAANAGQQGAAGAPARRCSTYEGSFTSCDDPTGLAARASTEPVAAWLLLYWTACGAGDHRACDRLAQESPDRSIAEDFGVTCGFQVTADAPARCEAELGRGERYAGLFGTNTQLDTLVLRCRAGDGGSCDALLDSAAAGSEYELVAATCGGSRYEFRGTSCRGEVVS